MFPDLCSLWHGYAINAAAPNPVLTRNAFLTVRLAISPASLIPENFHRPAEIHLPSGKSIWQIFSAIIAIKKPGPIMFHKRQFRVQHAIEFFLPNTVPEDVPYSWRASTSNNHAILQRNNKSYPWDIHLPHEGEKTNRQQDFRGFAAIKAGAKPNETSPARAGLFHGCANGGISSSS